MDLHLIASLLSRAVTVLGLDQPLHPWNLDAVMPPIPSWLDRVLAPACPLYDLDPTLVPAAFPAVDRDGIRQQIRDGLDHLIETQGQAWQPPDSAVVRVQLGVPLIGTDRVLVRIRTHNVFGTDAAPVIGEYHAWLDREGRMLSLDGDAQRALMAVWPRWVIGRSPGLGARVDLNHATLQQLRRLPGLSKRAAQAIITARPLAAVDGLRGVPGIGPRTIEKLRDFVTV